MGLERQSTGLERDLGTAKAEPKSMIGMVGSIMKYTTQTLPVSSSLQIPKQVELKIYIRIETCSNLWLDPNAIAG